MAEDSVYVADARGYPQGELFFMKGGSGHYESLVYNTTGLNQCPPEVFEAIDIEALAADMGCDKVWRNPRRFWMMDHLTVALVGEPGEFGGLRFNFVARMQMPPGFTPETGQSGVAYHPMQIRRVSTYEFLAGSAVFMLRSPDRMTYVMQTYTQHVDPNLTEADLPTLGDRLTLPEGWQFKTRTLDSNLTITTNGLAHIAADDLENMYQGYVEDVFNYDPWQ